MATRVIHRAALIDRAEHLGRKVARLAATLSIARWRYLLADAFQRIAMDGPIRRLTTRLLKLEARFTAALEAMTEAGYGSVAITIARNTAAKCDALERAAYHETMRGMDRVRSLPHTNEPTPCPDDATTRPNGSGPGSPATAPRSPRTSAPCATSPAAGTTPRITGNA